MPDRPKRRKNNRNKRKNSKGNKNDNINSNASVSETQIDNNFRKNDENDIVNISNQDLLVDDLSITGCNPGTSNLVTNEIIENEVLNKDNIINLKEETVPIACDKLKNTFEIVTEDEIQKRNTSREEEFQKGYAIVKKGEDIRKSSTASKEPNNINSTSYNLVNNYIEHECENDMHDDKSYDESLSLYLVESPEQNTAKKPKLTNSFKSKSVDNDDSPMIIEVTEEETCNEANSSLCIIDSNNAIINDDELDIEWHKTDELESIDTVPKIDVINILSVTTIPLNIAQCSQANSLSPEEENSLRSFLNTLKLSANPEGSDTLEIKAEIEQMINREIRHRLRKRGLADDFLLQRAGPSRSLAVIDEEGSSESSITSRRQSYLSEKISDSEELEDEVFENKVRPLNKVDSGRQNYTGAVQKGTSFRQVIPQECIRVDAKLKEPEITEARGSWSMKTIEKMTGAELVYLTDSSSSTSSLYDNNDDNENAEDTDVSVRIITPTIEVTDTEKLLKSTNCESSKTINDINISTSTTPDKTAKETAVQTKTVLVEEPNNTFTNPHEIIVDRTDNIQTNLFVKDIVDDISMQNNLLVFPNNVVDSNQNDVVNTKDNLPKEVDNYDLEIKVIKCELNDAINNLLKEVISTKEGITDQSEDLLPRQDSSSSVGSSQCTAKYNPNHSSLNDVADLAFDIPKENYQINHVKEVYKHVNEMNLKNNFKDYSNFLQPQSLRIMCLNTISSLPYGDKVIEELATVSERLQDMSIFSAGSRTNEDLKENPKIIQKNVDTLNQKKTESFHEFKPVPPPIQPRTSSFKIIQEETKKDVSNDSELISKCLSPSHKMLIEKINAFTPKEKKNKNNTIINKVDNSKTTEINQEYLKNPVGPPLKSETGSRLLSLLRNSSSRSENISVTNNSGENQSQEHMIKARLSEPYSSFYNSLNKIKFSESNSPVESTLNKFKPIPPPKLRTFSSSFYESDDSSEFIENSLRKIHDKRNYFHFSTGNLNKDIENDISTIQNMHKHYVNIRDTSSELRPRRPSLPKDLCDQQMEYIRQKEKEVDAEIRRLEQEKGQKRNPRAPMISEESFERRINSTFEKPIIKDSHPHKFAKRNMSSLFSSSEEELLREKMYTEYVSQMAEREKRREQKIIKITKPSMSLSCKTISKSMTALDITDNWANNPIESEFITKARERWNKLGIRDPETEDEKDYECNVYKEPRVIEHKIKVIDAGEEKDVQKLPKHLQDFVKFTVKEKERLNSPGESDPEKKSAHVVVLCAVIVLILTVSRYIMRMILNR